MKIESIKDLRGVMMRCHNVSLGEREPTCPKCGLPLTEDDCLDLDNEGEYVHAFLVGHCEDCQINYQWDEYFFPIGATAPREC